MYLTVKRFSDLIVAVIALLILSFILIPIALLLRFTGEKKVFYFQERIGYKNKPFFIYKFATMLENSMNMGLGGTTVRNDPRITPVGKYLRFTKLNELPQLINVILGDMSFVGARPLPLSSFKKYTEEVQNLVYTNRPGITGIGSLVFRDEEKLITAVIEKGLDHRNYYQEYIYPYKGELEKWYAHNLSFLVDMKIILLTAWSILFPNSTLVFSLFSNLPIRPDALKVDKINSVEI